MRRLIISGGTVVPMDGRRVISPGYVVVEGSLIREVTDSPPLPSRHDTVVDATGCLVTPGFINTHHHFFQTLTRAYPTATDCALFPWLRALYPVWEGITAESVRLSTTVAMLELLTSGCTTTSDHHYLFPHGADPHLVDVQVEVAKALGMRFVATRGSMSRGVSMGGLPPDSVVQDEETILRDCARVVERYHDPDPHAMVQVALAPCSPFSVSPRLMEQTAALAAQLGVRLHTHLAETPDELEYCRRHYGCTPVELLERTGWLHSGTWVAHGIHFSARDMEILGRAGVGVAHCPSSNMRLGSGIARVAKLREAGCPVGLGVDGSASNDSSHMLLEVRQALLLGRLASGADGFSVWDALELATTGGAACLGRAQALGRLCPGYAADIAVFDLRTLSHSGAHDPVAALVLCAPQPATHVFIAGQWVVECGTVRGVDMDSLLLQHGREAQRLRARHEAWERRR